MQIHEYLRKKDIYTYNLIMKKYGFNPEKQKEEKKQKKKKSGIELGDSVQNLMKHRAYKRHRGALKQIRYE
ncbi:hypothetical protein [Caloranaerobacter ferrireducens]|uniref:hypothetical protein n=1 Tax=Caloranaerobacter ferrireducens TaxID=1323370 RepID=UPI00084DC847|nr:hypothetical protein [Caloranaerobacter ferrireducens]